VIAARQAGFNVLRFFPASESGGVAMLQALYSAFPDVLFCPAGGVTRVIAAEFLALPNVVCVAGSWFAPPAMLAAGDWAGIEAVAREAAKMRTHS
jgi:2-dehydro-3-deoxyphosphogluconate aldolase/(4S)-4-hydroxy-2-oxoglutarate aldolase